MAVMPRGSVVLDLYTEEQLNELPEDDLWQWWRAKMAYTTGPAAKWEKPAHEEGHEGHEVSEVLDSSCRRKDKKPRSILEDLKIVVEEMEQREAVQAEKAKKIVVKQEAEKAKKIVVKGRRLKAKK